MDGGGEVHEVPMHVIQRPLVQSLNEDKVQSIMETILSNPEEVPPITVLWLKGTEGGNYYYGFGGCHRFEAHKRLGRSSVHAILQKSSLDSLRNMLGSSTPKSLK